MFNDPYSSPTAGSQELDPFWESEIDTTRDRTWPQSNLSPEQLFTQGSIFKPTQRQEIVGIDNVLNEIDDVIHWLKHSEKYASFGSRLEPGIVFEGAPGTGKTLVSRYIATASDALFVNVRDWPHTGTILRDYELKALFQKARQTYAHQRRPIVLFWDEFENAGWERSRANTEVQAVVSQLTAELDGVHGKNEGILLIGCTNYIRGIDHALLRSGRMGLHIEFHAPDREGKKVLLGHYLRDYTAGSVDLDTLSFFFESGATAADIEESCVEAWRFAVRRGIGEKADPKLSQEDLVEVFLKRLVGPPTTFINLPQKDRLRIAIHEVGHALAALVYDIPLRLITVYPGKKSLGRTMIAEPREHIGTLEEHVSQMRIGLGSIAAEEACGIPAMDGSSGDITQVNKIAAQLIDTHSYSERVGVFNAGVIASTRSVDCDIISQSACEVPDRQINLLLDRMQDESRTMMAKIGPANVREISERVNDKVTLTGTQFRELAAEVIGHGNFADFRA